MSELKTIKFIRHPNYAGQYICYDDGDQSGEYVRADLAKEMLDVVKELARVKRAGVSAKLMAAAIAAFNKSEPTAGREM